MALYGFENVIAWQKAHSFVISVYTITRDFPKEELYGLTSQFRRAAVSIEANIAEGYRKLSKSDKLRFFNISQGSLEECRNYILLTRDLHFADDEAVQQLTQQLEQASWFLNKYCQGIINNNGVSDE